MYHTPYPPVRPPDKSFWKSGGGIALIISGGVVALGLLMVLCCFGAIGIGAASCDNHPERSTCQEMR